MTLRRQVKYRYRNGEYRKFWGCTRWPKCDGTIGAHPNGCPLGIPVTKNIQSLRVQAHKLAEKIWGDFNKITKAERNAMYAWIRENSSKGHIGKMIEPELKDLIKKLERKKIEHEPTNND